MYFIRSNIQQKQHINTMTCEHWAGLTRLERALTVAYNGTQNRQNSSTKSRHS